MRIDTTTAAHLMCAVTLGALVAGGTPAAAGEMETCEAMKGFEADGSSLEITRAEWIPPGPAEANVFGQLWPGELPAYCRVEGEIDKRTGAGGKPYAIRFALALPGDWNGSLLFQGGSGLNGVLQPPLGETAAGDTPALARGFAVVSTDSGHTGEHLFDAGFFEDQEATLNLLYKAIGKVSVTAKQLIAAFYKKPVEHSYYVGCSEGGREGMIMSQRYPTYFDGIVSGAPAIRPNFSDLGDRWVIVSLNAAARRDESGEAIPGTAFDAAELKLLIDALLDECDDDDGVDDGMIFDPFGCTFDPAALQCEGDAKGSCLSEIQIMALKRAMAGPVDSRGNQVYPGFLYDTGIAAPPESFIPGLLTMTDGPVIGRITDTEMDVDDASVKAADAIAAVGDSTWTNLSTFSGNGGKLILYHGVSDPWMSALDTLGYYERMTEANGGREAVEDWSRLFLIPGMGHCGGGAKALDRFDMLTSIVAWVEEDKAPGSVVATGKAFPGRSRPLCPHPRHAQYAGHGDPEEAASFRCVEPAVE